MRAILSFHNANYQVNENPCIFPVHHSSVLLDCVDLQALHYNATPSQQNTSSQIERFVWNKDLKHELHKRPQNTMNALFEFIHSIFVCSYWSSTVNDLLVGFISIVDAINFFSHFFQIFNVWRERKTGKKKPNVQFVSSGEKSGKVKKKEIALKLLVNVTTIYEED